MPEELCQVSPKSHYVSLALHSDPSPFEFLPIFDHLQRLLQGRLAEMKCVSNSISRLSPLLMRGNSAILVNRIPSAP